MAVESLSTVCAEESASGAFLHISHVQMVPEEKNHGLPERLAVAEIVSGVLVQKKY